MELHKLNFIWYVFRHFINEFKLLEAAIKYEFFKLSRFFNFEIQMFSINYYLLINISIFGLFDFHISYNDEDDHAGFYFNINVLGLFFEFNIYDIRHWDFDNECWEK